MLAVGVIDDAGSVSTVSPYFSRRLNWINDGLTDQEAYTFGHEIGKTFEPGFREYKLVENYDLISNIKEVFKPHTVHAQLVNELNGESSRFTVGTLGSYDMVFPFLIHNVGVINQGIRDGQGRDYSKKRTRLIG